METTGAVPTSEPSLWKPQGWFQHQNRVCGNHRSGSNIRTVSVETTGVVPTSEPCLWKPQERFQHQNRVCGNHRCGSNIRTVSVETIGAIPTSEPSLGVLCSTQKSYLSPPFSWWEKELCTLSK